MILIGAGGQYNAGQPLYDASGTIASGGTCQIILPRARARSSLILENISDTNMYVEFGGARATATLTGNIVTSCSVTNSGQGYSIAPLVEFYGGGNTGNNQNNPTFGSATLPDYPAPANPATAHCIMTGSAPNMSISSIVIDNQGSGYAIAPYVYLRNRHNDAYGVATASATSGMLLLANGGSYTPNGTVCTTDQISIFCATSGKAFTCKFSL